jgi:hypothetical protein
MMRHLTTHDSSRGVKRGIGMMVASLPGDRHGGFLIDRKTGDIY